MTDYFESSTREPEYLRLWQPRKKIPSINMTSKKDKDQGKEQEAGLTIDIDQQFNIRQLVKAIAKRINNDHPPTCSVLGKVKSKFGFRSYRKIHQSQYDSIIDFLNNWERTLSNMENPTQFSNQKL